MLQIRNWGHDLIGLLFPDLCNACHTHLLKGEKLICTACLYDLPYTDYHFFEANRVAKQFWGRMQFQAAMAMLYYKKGTKVQQLIHQLKYKDKTDLGIFLGELLSHRLSQSRLYGGIDLIIPVPLHPRKLRQRGYNQSHFIAKGLSSGMGIPLEEKILIRITETKSQTKKGRYNRYENMVDVFKVETPARLEGKHILLVDDVITTGATVEACATVLLKQGAQKISIAALAFAE